MKKITYYLFNSSTDYYLNFIFDYKILNLLKIQLIYIKKYEQIRKNTKKNT